MELRGEHVRLRPLVHADADWVLEMLREPQVARWWPEYSGAEQVRAELIDERGHHRITIDPAADNARAIRCNESAGFRAVGVMRAYERRPDGSWRNGLLMDLLAGVDDHRSRP